MAISKQGCQYHLPCLVYAPDLPLATAKRLPKGWSAFPVPPAWLGEETSIAWDNPPRPQDKPGWLCLSVALDDREDRTLTVISTQTRQVLGVLDIRHEHSFYPLELKLSVPALGRLLNESFSLITEKGREPIWFFNANPSPDGCPSLMPHLLLNIGQQPVLEFMIRLSSLTSLQFFGWQEGVVLDG